MRILTVFGTRPEAIKLAPVILELKGRAEIDEIQPLTCVTGQHRQMLDQVLNLFGIVPDYDLNLMRENQTPTQIASDILTHLQPILMKEKPDWILLQGDTTTVLAASIAAFYSRIKVGHVEAGLRTGDKWQPFPEEINRRVASVVADLHFAPTENARQNLLRENIPDEIIYTTGNTVIDALQWAVKQPFDLNQLGLHPSIWVSSDVKIILVTAHRRENFGHPLENICLALKDIAECMGGQIHIVYSVHMNPNVWEPVHRLLKGVPYVTLLPPLDYLPLVHLMKHAYLILTDSGGIQEEAPSLGVPVMVLREVTERPEAVAAGTVKLVGADREYIVKQIIDLLQNTEIYQQMSQAINPYGDGKAASRIVQAVLGKQPKPFRPKERA